MSRPRKRPDLVPLVLSGPEVAELVFRRSESWFRKWLREHPDAVFPRPDDLGNYHRGQIERWLAVRFGLVDPIAVAIDEENENRARRERGKGTR